MTKTTRFAVTLAALALIGGCAGATVLHSGNVYPSYTPEILNYSATEGGMLTEVVGNPFAGSKAELDAAVTETAARSHFGQKVPFFTQAPEGYGSPYRVVFAMNPVLGTSAYDLCRGAVKFQARAPKESDRVNAALCAREVEITSIKGSVAGSLGPRDPVFLDLIAQLSLALFPPTATDRRGDSRIFKTF